MSEEHATIRAYVTGFLASLLFTLIPYYLVQHQKGGGTYLLATILMLAVVQLIIQIKYFLHLGRGPKPRWELYFFLATASIILVVVGGSLIIIHNLHSNMSLPEQQKKVINDEAIAQVGGKLTGACQMQLTNHQIIIKAGALKPAHITANKCDTLTFVNEDSLTHTFTFGTYPAKGSYAGVDAYELHSGATKTFTLSDAGNYTFYDRLHTWITGSFLVIDEGQGTYGGQ